MEMLLTVSYYFDKQFYADNDVESPADEDIDLTKYVAGGVVAISLGDGPRKSTMWSVHLDLTTELTVTHATIRRCLCLVCSTAFKAKALPLSRAFHCIHDRDAAFVSCLHCIHG